MSRILMLAPALLIAGCAMNENPEARADTEARLAAELRGHEQSGPAMGCVQMRDLRGNRSVGNAIVFEGPGDRIWVNRPAGACSLKRGRALQTRTVNTQLCRGDFATVFDPSSGIEFGGCVLGEFVPYRPVAG